MPTPALPMTAPPVAPDRADRATFAARATASFDHLKNHATPEIAAAMANVYGNAVEAAESAATATAMSGVASTAASASAAAAAQTENDRTRTGQDATATAQDRTQTGLDRAAAEASAASASAVSGIPVIVGNSGRFLHVKADGSGIEWADPVSVTLTGNLSPYVTQTVVLSLTNHDSGTEYSVSATGGTVSMSGDAITYVAGAVAGPYAININGRSVPVTVRAAAVAAPTVISPAAGAINVVQNPTITTSAFTAIGFTDTHLNTDWEIRTAASGAGTLIASSLADATNKLSWTVPGSLLAVATTYYVRARHRGTAHGAGVWGEVRFTTSATFSGIIGKQGEQGFGCGVYPGTLPSGFSAMTGTADASSANYGNYQFTDGSVMVFVPKFFYRIGNASSPRYGFYGVNALDIVGTETFENEAAANAGGYAMHRAFYDGGTEKSGFFVDKYLASKTGTTSCKSIANVDPISLTTTAGSNPSNTQTGCTGILADAIVLARSRGALFNAEPVFIRSALALLSLAHGQAATGSQSCAWHDPLLTTNYPKGCNNGALADTIDATVTYAASSYSPKPKTRAITNFAKTTHNGQECGIADLNGSMYQALVGMTTPGASATDAVKRTDGNCYVLKRSVALASLTGGYGGGSDAWGTAENLAVNYDLVEGLLPWGGAVGVVCFGNGAANVFSGDVSGTSYQRTACGVQNTVSGASVDGTNLFGNDTCTQGIYANSIPTAGGGWMDRSRCGVFSRDYSTARAMTGNYFTGFRCVCYGN